jgi:hypothetical protein
MVTLTVNASLAGAADTTPPVLSSGASGAITATTWAGTITTDEGNGVLYTLVTQSASATASAVKAGGTMLAILSTGAKDISFTGLTPDTTGYFAHVMHEDAAGNQSAVTTIGPFDTPTLGTGTGTVTLSVEREGGRKNGANGIAPHSVYFRVGVSGATLSEPGNETDYDLTAQGLHYVLDAGLGGVTPGTYMERMRLGTNDLNKGSGKYPAICYAEPGTYTPTVHVYEEDGTFVGSASLTLTVDDPDAVYTGNRTILVNAAGAGDAGYTGAQTTTTLDQALNLARALNQDCQILLKRGETFTKNSQFDIDQNDDSILIGDYGTGAMPILDNTGGTFSLAMFTFQNLGNIDLCFRNIRFEGRWNSISETGTAINLIRMLLTSGTTQRGVCIVNCEFDGWNEICQLGNNPPTPNQNAYLMVWNIKTTNWNGFQFYSTANIGTYICLKGVSGIQTETARLGGDLSGGNSYGLMRIQCCPRINIDVVETFCRQGRDATLLTQPSMRINTGPNLTLMQTVKRPVGHLSRLYVEGGATCISLSSAESGGSPVYGVCVTLERSTIVGTSMTRHHVLVAQAGVDIRNCIFVQPNAKRVSPYTRLWNAFVNGDTDWISEQQDSTSPVRVRYNTFINLLDDTNRNGNTLNATLNMGTVFGGRYIEENNVLYTPNATGQPGETPIGVSQSVMQSASGDIVPAWTNVHHAATSSIPAQLTPDYSFASPAGSIWDATPTAGSALIGDANANPIFNDHAGNVRGASRDRGAMERV